VGNVSTNVCAKFRGEESLRELITTTATSRVAFWDLPSGPKNFLQQLLKRFIFATPLHAKKG